MGERPLKMIFMNGKRLDELERVIVLYQDMLFRFAFFRTGSRADAEDIVQEVFLKMFDSGRDLSHVCNLKSYLYRCVANACADWRKGRCDVGGLPADRAAEEETDGAWKEEYERIDRLLAGIPCEQAEVIRMRCIDGLGFGEIADMLGVPLPTAKSRFRYGIEKLRTIKK